MKPEIINYGDILEPIIEQYSPNRVLLLGIAGIGKTTLMQYLVYSWGIQTQQNMQGMFYYLWNQVLSFFTEDKIVNDKIMFFIKLREIQNNQTLCDALYGELLEDINIGKEDFCIFVKDNKARIVLLLDGCDEYNDNTSREITKVIKNKLMLSSLIVISSRPGKASTLMRNNTIHYSYTLHGFSESHSQSYISNYFTSNNEVNTGHTLTKRLFRDNLIERKLLRIPMFIHLFCVLWRDTNLIPITTTEIYLQFVNYALRKKSSDNMTNNKAEIMSTLARVAAIQSWQWNDVISFKESNDNISFSNQELHFLTQSGFVVFEQDTKIQLLNKKQNSFNNVYFIHKSFREYFYAKYITDTNQTIAFLNTLLEIKMDYNTIAVFEEEFVFVQRFVCGLANSGEELLDIIAVYTTYYMKLLEANSLTSGCDVLNPFKDNIALCMTEAYHLLFNSSVLQERYLALNNNNLHYSDYLGDNKYILLLRASMRHSMGSINLNLKVHKCYTDVFDILDFAILCLHLFQNLEKIYIGEVRGELHTLKVNQDFFYLFKHEGPIKELELPLPWNVEKNKMKKLLKSLRKLQNLQSLGINTNLEGMGNLLAGIFHYRGGKIKSLTLVNSNFHTLDMKQINSHFKYLQSLAQLELINIDLYHNYFVNFGQNLTLSKITKNPIVTLKITGSTFSDKTTVEFFNSIAHSNNLNKLTLKQVKFDMKKFEKHSILMKTVPNLSLINIGEVSGQSVKTITRSIKSLNNLYILDMTWKNSFWNQMFGYDYMVDVANALSNVETLYHDAYQNISLKNNMSNTIRSISKSSGILMLSFTVDYISESGLEALSKMLMSPNFKTLQRFDLYSSYELPKEKFAMFLASFKYANNISYLWLSNLNKEHTLKLRTGIKHLHSLKLLGIVDAKYHASFFLEINNILGKLKNLKIFLIYRAIDLPLTKDGIGKMLILLGKSDDRLDCGINSVLDIGNTKFNNNDLINIVNILIYVCEELDKFYLYNKNRAKIQLNFDHDNTYIASNVNKSHCFIFKAYQDRSISLNKMFYN